MGSLPRPSPRPSTAPASVPPGAGSSRCLRAAPLKPCASTHAFWAGVSGASRTQPASRASQMGIDFFLLSEASRTLPGPAACLVFSLDAIADFVKGRSAALSVGHATLTIAAAVGVVGKTHELSPRHRQQGL